MTDAERQVIMRQIARIKEIGTSTAKHLQEAVRGLNLCHQYLVALEQVLVDQNKG